MYVVSRSRIEESGPLAHNMAEAIGIVAVIGTVVGVPCVGKRRAMKTNGELPLGHVVVLPATDVVASVPD